MGGIDEPLCYSNQSSRRLYDRALSPHDYGTVHRYGITVRGAHISMYPYQYGLYIRICLMVAVESVMFWRERVQTFSPGTVGGCGFGNQFLSPTNNQQPLQEPRQSSETGV